jgi:hypothetical protein
VTRYNHKKHTSYSQKSWEEYKDKLIEEEKQMMREVANHLEEDPDSENLAERIGWGKTLEEKWD